MKADSDDMNLQELFRRNLENAEIIPDALVKSKLMSRLAWHEFVHFIPNKFNVYYLAGVLIATVAAVLIIDSSGRSTDQLPDLRTPEKSESPVKTEKIATTVPAPVIRKEKSLFTIPVTTDSVQTNDDKVVTITESILDSGKRENNIISSTGFNQSLSKKGLFTPSINNGSKLQIRNTSEKLSFEPSVTEGCAPLRILFNNNLSGNDSCLWSFGDGGNSSDRNPEWIFDVEGDYNVVLKIFRSNGNIETTSTLIKVYPKPSARFEIFPEKAILPDDEIRFINYSTEAVKYKWEFGDGNTSELFEPVHKYQKFGIYDVQLFISSEKGCSDSLLIMNAFVGSAYFINFPNAFIPNPDGPAGGSYSSKTDESARIFHPSYAGIAEYQLKIFNKTGMLLFETNDINTGWDGYYHGQLCNRGVYIWKVRGNFRNGETFIKMGDVTLLQN